MEKVIVTIKNYDQAQGATVEETVAFRGQKVAEAEHGGVGYVLYETPVGYRVIETHNPGHVTLEPFEGGPLPLGDRVYGHFTQAAVASRYLPFAGAVAGPRLV